jgi:hypothetical protein
MMTSKPDTKVMNTGQIETSYEKCQPSEECPGIVPYDFSSCFLRFMREIIFLCDQVVWCNIGYYLVYLLFCKLFGARSTYKPTQ